MGNSFERASSRQNTKHFREKIEEKEETLKEKKAQFHSKRKKPRFHFAFEKKFEFGKFQRKKGSLFQEIFFKKLTPNENQKGLLKEKSRKERNWVIFFNE